MDADLGGTEILEPLKLDMYKQKRTLDILYLYSY